MKTTRRSFMKGGMAAAALAGGPGMALPGIARAQTAPSPARTLKAVMQGDLRVFDPIWTTANISAYHGAMIYDTLFALDANLQPKPQMVEKYAVSDNKLEWSFQLRDGLKFSDGTPVTTADVVPSIRRWAARDGAGQHMMGRVKDISAKDEKSFAIALKEPYGLVAEAMAKTSTPLLYIMRKKEAETDPNEQIKEYVGSGPFVFNQTETKQGVRYVYDKSPTYVPRSDPTSGMAGAKIVKLDRVSYENIGDSQTAMAALQAGEIDFFELPPLDLIETLEADKNITIETLNKLGNTGWLRMNWLHPPFDNVYARQAMLHLINQEDILKATFGNPKYFRTCGSLFGCGTPMENDANLGWFKEGQNIAKAKELFQKAGYDGRPVIVMQATNIDFMRNSAELVAQWMRQAGLNVELASSDWGGVVTRRAVKSKPSEGGWNIFITWAGTTSIGSPIAAAGHASNGEKGWFGWPTDATHEKLRDQWAAAPDLDTQKKIAREMQENGWNYVPFVYLGQWVAPTARRANVKGFISVPEIIPFWNVEKT